MIDTKAITISSYLSYTLNNFIFKQFIDDNQDFSDNKLAGVPSEIFNTEIDINTDFGLYGSINFQYVEPIPIMDSNSLFSNSYNLSNIKAEYKLSIIKKLALNTFIGIDNVFDERFASQILINARSFGGKASRYFYHGNPINYYMGIHVNYVF